MKNYQRLNQNFYWGRPRLSLKIGLFLPFVVVAVAKAATLTENQENGKLRQESTSKSNLDGNDSTQISNKPSRFDSNGSDLLQIESPPKLLVRSPRELIGSTNEETFRSRDLISLLDFQHDNINGVGKRAQRSVDHNELVKEQQERVTNQNEPVELADKLALEEQQRLQSEIISDLAVSEAKAIRDQRKALTRQAEILTRDQFHDAINDEENDQRWRRSLEQANEQESSSPSDLVKKFQSSSSADYDDEASDPDDDNIDQDASNLNNYYDLSPAAQHHNYGSHYGSLHKHLSKYYQ